MPAPILGELDAQVTQTVGVQASAAVLLRGISAKVQAAVDAALANGATAAELAPVTAVVAALKSSTDDLSSAVAENPGTPA